MSSSAGTQPRRRWRFYATASGRKPVKDALDDLSALDAASVAAAMIEARSLGREHPDVNHLRGDIWQMEIDGQRVIYRLLFAEEGRSGRILLALELVKKKWQKARERHIKTAEDRLADWRGQPRPNS